MHDGGGGFLFTDVNFKHFYQAVYDPSFNLVPGPQNDQLTHVQSYASPETRNQGDFKLGYEWDEAALDVGGGISVENDYDSSFANLGGRFDFNQKQTTVNWGVSYTNSDTFATLDPDGLPYENTSQYDNSTAVVEFVEPDDGSLPYPIVITTPVKPKVASGELESTWTFDENSGTLSRTAVLEGNRQDWGGQLGLAQVLNKDALVALDLGYIRSTGYLANPYKSVYAIGYDVQEPADASGLRLARSYTLLEIRPDERNLLNWHLGYDQFIEAFNAALHFDYHFAHDDWGIHAHTFEADWVQPLGAGWVITPRIRYYSQSAADFYTPFVTYITDGLNPDTAEPIYIEAFPQYYSSDQRLSGFGALSGGLTVSKQFAKGVSLETGFEYYTHQGGLKLGGGGASRILPIMTFGSPTLRSRLIWVR